MFLYFFQKSKVTLPPGPKDWMLKGMRHVMFQFIYYHYNATTAQVLLSTHASATFTFYPE